MFPPHAPALVRLGASPDADGWARSGADLRAGLRKPPMSAESDLIASATSQPAEWLIAS